MIQAVIKSTGSYLPKKNLTNHELEKQLDTTHEWIYTRTGIESRHIAADYETTSYMAAQAGKQALITANLLPSDIDLIIVATCTPNHFFPSIACHVQAELKIPGYIPAFDVSAACSGFMYALDVAKQYINTGSAQNILVIGSESMSRALNWSDRATCVLFGDGAGALILSSTQSETGIIGSILHSSYDEKSLLSYPNYTNQSHPSYIGMQGGEVFKIAVNIMGDVVEELLAICKLTKEDINWLIPHQANIRIIQAIAKKLNMTMEQVILTIATHGNTSAASIPLALDHGIRNNLIHRGQLLLLESFGAGLTWGAIAIRY